MFIACMKLAMASAQCSEDHAFEKITLLVCAE